MQADEAPQAGKLPAIMSALHNRTVRLVMTAVVALTLMFSFWPAAAHFLAQVPSGAWADEADVLGLQAAGALGLQAKLQPEVISMGVAVAPMYLNPLRDVPDLTLERIDQGVDFNGSGPVFALGDGVVLAASADYPGLGGWVDHLPALQRTGCRAGRLRGRGCHADGSGRRPGDTLDRDRRHV